MEIRVMIVVGDKFAQFAAGKDALTISQLTTLLAMPNLMAQSHGRMVLVPGQGLADDDIAAVLCLAENAPHADRFDLTLWHRVPSRAAEGLSHKRHLRNSVISEPRRVDEDMFELDLLVDDECELMGDHQTGQHIQGMILAEAARQAFLAVTEAFFLPDDGVGRYFVIDTMTIRYLRFVFPVGAKLRYRVVEKDLSPGRQRFKVDIAIEQGGADGAVAGFGFTVYPAERISRKEGEMAETVLDAYLAAMTGGLPHMPEAA